ncbi:uncharacterized protein LOC129742534 [Uranotaenia lowii]|uniref:uncharacterized protein LOC129742534 n=1 Tax=Uranotaenia lowii TaxID=190385 RepID=UPI00247A8947|nr:uncharacterized protein LOC129742534 [Uranotaenia lowii]
MEAPTAKEVYMAKYGDSVALIKTWIESQPHLPKIEDEFILLFLHCNYYELARTKTTIENYFTFRTSCTALFTGQDLESTEMRVAMDTIDFVPLPRPTPEGFKLALVKLANTDTRQFSHAQITKFMIMCSEVWLQDDGMAEGHVIIYDMTGATLGHLARVSVFVAKNYLYFLQEASPIRLKGFQFLNTVSFMDKILFIIKPFMKKELFDALKLHTNVESLLEIVPSKCLPDEYGGSAGKYQHLKENFYKKVVNNRDTFLLNEKNHRVDESRRVRESGRFGFLVKAFGYGNIDSACLFLRAGILTHSNQIVAMKVLDYANVDNLYARCPDLRKKDVRDLDAWVKEQPHLPEVTELELILFIHSNYFDMDAAKRTIEAYYTFRSSYKDFFGNRDILEPSMRQAMDVVSINILPGLTPLGYRVLLAKIIDSDTKKFNLANLLKMAFMCLDKILLEDGCDEGAILMIDMNGLHIGHLSKLGVFTLKNFIWYIQEALPIRLKSIHLINVVPFIDKILMMIKPFIKKELLEMFQIHQKVETVFPNVPQAMFPIEYDGNAPSRSIMADNLYQSTMDYREFFLHMEEAKKVDESKRIKVKSISNMFGLF